MTRTKKKKILQRIARMEAEGMMLPIATKDPLSEGGLLTTAFKNSRLLNHRGNRLANAPTNNFDTDAVLDWFGAVSKGDLPSFFHKAIEAGVERKHAVAWNQWRTNTDLLKRAAKQKAKKKDRIQDFKDNWNTMEPARVGKFIPNGQAVGLEIEFLCMSKWYSANNIDDPQEGHWDSHEKDFIPNNDLYGVSWGYDCSLRTSEDYHYHKGQEVRILLNNNKWFRLHKLLAHLKQQRCEVNKTCGLHVWLDTRGSSEHNVVTQCRRLESALPWLKYIVPKSRRSNTYCELLYSKSMKYAAINHHAFRRPALEVRLHSSSLNATKIIRWIELLQFIRHNYTHLKTMDSLLNSKAPNTLKKWVLRRFDELNPPDPTIAEPDCSSEQISERTDIEPQATPRNNLPPLPTRTN